jgi:HD-like signal output (HDOD) protein
MMDATASAIKFLTGSYFPSLPDSVFKIKKEIDSGHPNLRQIANYIASEGELALKFIDLTRELIGNALGSTPSVFNIVNRLGMDSVYELLIAAFLERQLIRTEFDQKVVTMCRRNALACFYLAQDVRLINQSEAYLTRIFHKFALTLLAP